MPTANTWTVTVPAAGPWLTANSRLHRMAEARLVKAWRAAAYWASTSARTPVGVDVARLDVLYVFVGRKPVREIVNLEPTLKAIVDGAIGPATKTAPGRGIVVDDSDKHLIYGVRSFHVVKRTDPGVLLLNRVVLTVTDLSAGHDWQERYGRGGALMQRQCGTCELWETELARATPCHKPRLRIV